MKATNIKQLILNFIGGGKIKFPTRFLKSIDVESPDISQGVEITPELLDDETILKKINNWGLTDEEIRELPIITNINNSKLDFQYDEDLRCNTNFSQCVILTRRAGVPHKFEYIGDHLDELFTYVKDLEYLLYYTGNVGENATTIEDDKYNMCTVLKKGENATDSYVEFNGISLSFGIIFKLSKAPMVYIGPDNF